MPRGSKKRVKPSKNTVPPLCKEANFIINVKADKSSCSGESEIIREANRIIENEILENRQKILKSSVKKRFPHLKWYFAGMGSLASALILLRLFSFFL